MRRQYDISSEEQQSKLLFYASFASSLTPEYTYDGNVELLSTSYCSASNGVMQSTNKNMCYKSASPIPAISEGEGITFCCYVKRTANSGICYSFGAAHSTNSTKYAGLQLVSYSSNVLVTEYLYFVTGYSINFSTLAFWAWTIHFNGSNSYTVKVYKDGVLVFTKTFSNTSWLGFANCYFAIGHASSNSCIGEFSHFSAWRELTDSEVLELYNAGGVAV